MSPITKFTSPGGASITRANQTCSVAVRRRIRDALINLNNYIHGNVSVKVADSSEKSKKYATCYNLRTLTDECKLFDEEWNDGQPKETNVTPYGSPLGMYSTLPNLE